MVKIIYIAHNGDESCVDVALGLSVMEGAVHSSVRGIDGDCGGACACATCHVYIDPVWRDTVGGPSEMEAEMLELARNTGDGSRLSCQIPVTEELDGLLVRMPESQQ